MCFEVAAADRSVDSCDNARREFDVDNKRLSRSDSSSNKNALNDIVFVRQNKSINRLSYFNSFPSRRVVH